MTKTSKPLYILGLLLMSGLLAACNLREVDAPQVVIVVATTTPHDALPVEPDVSLVPTETPTPEPTQTPSPTPNPPIHQLTEGGCCVQPSWSNDSQRVLFIDRPADDAVTGIYAVDIAQPLVPPMFVEELLGIFSSDFRLVAYPDGPDTFVERVSDGERWLIPNGGRPVTFSPNILNIVWQIEQQDGPFDQQRTDIHLARFTGEDPVFITTVYGGGFVGWLDNQRMVFLGRPSLDVRERTLTVLSLNTNVAVDLVSAERVRSIQMSPSGSWLAYYIAQDDDAARNGVWIQHSDGSDARQLDFWGAYQWRDDSHLLYIPMRESSDVPFVIWEYDVTAATSRPLTDPSEVPIFIANGDWQVSPDGRYIVYVSSIDHNLWYVELETE